MTDPILRFIGEVFVVWGGAAVVAILIFKYLGKSWIDSKFNERLEEFKHQQAIEIERMRVEIDATLSGVLKIQEKEFETLPTAWSKLDEAHSYVVDLVSPLQKNPDVDGMTEDRLIEFLNETNIRETEKDRIRNSDDKTKRYQEIMFWYRLHKVQLTCDDLNKYIVRYGIFFPPNLKDLFDKIVNQLNAAVRAQAVGQEVDDFELKHKAWEKTRDVIVPLFREIEDGIHVRLQSHGAS